MTCNKNSIPNDPQRPMVTSGIRLGSPAMTTRGFKEEQSRATANLIADVLDNPRDEDEHSGRAGTGGGVGGCLPRLSVTSPGLHWPPRADLWGSLQAARFPPKVCALLVPRLCTEGRNTEGTARERTGATCPNDFVGLVGKSASAVVLFLRFAVRDCFYLHS